MDESKVTTQVDTLPDNFDSIEAFWEFWDTHSTADYEDLMQPVDVEINIQSDSVYLAVAKDLLDQLRAHARQQGVSTETLVNLWLQEKLATVHS